MPKTFKCQVVTPEGPVLERSVTAAVLPAHDGHYGVLPDHAPMIAMLGAGTLTLRSGPSQAWFLEIAGGFAEIRQNKLMVLTEQAGRLIESTGEISSTSLDEARKDLAVGDEANDKQED